MTRKAKAPRRRLWPRALGLLVLAGMGLAAWLLFWPPVGRLAYQDPTASAFMQAQQDEWRDEGSDRRLRHRFVSLANISPYLQQAVLIAEDDKFYSHDGFDYDMIKQAMERNLEAGEIRYGASTITQQLAKNLYLSPERNLWRKLREAVLAWRLERELTKDRILELYLNFVEWGPGIYGAEAAAKAHFGVGAARLSPGQAARLAAVIPSPGRLDPTAKRGYVPRRAAKLLAEMRRRGPGKIWR